MSRVKNDVRAIWIVSAVLALAGAVTIEAVGSEPGSAIAKEGQAAATLQPDPLDVPAATSVEEAAKAARLVENAHAMNHGTYRHTDAGRAAAPAASPSAAAPAHQHHHHGAPASPSPRPSPSPKGHQ